MLTITKSDKSMKPVSEVSRILFRRFSPERCGKVFMNVDYLKMSCYYWEQPCIIEKYVRKYVWYTSKSIMSLEMT